ncbi:MAG: hypothetical protein SPJ41_00010 [Candidatus Onthovivens sp.]|nr:hypothetical protein [Candidatus Onthovivens sp.]
MSFDIILNNEKKTIEKKVKLLDLTNDNTDIICALVNGRIRELEYEVYYPATINFLTVKDHDAMGIYERGIRFIFAMAAHILYPNLSFFPYSFLNIFVHKISAHYLYSLILYQALII